MPDNIGNIPPWLGGVLMAVAMSIVRVIYDSSETSLKRIFAEAFICGALTVASGSALIEMGYGSGGYLFCGGFIGFMGSQAIRAAAHKFLDKTTGS
ncbi:MAG: phage holin, lambda family [Gammaproteobacteria bacterium]|nr:phage holin, lambda family [Gammaproteobacteria bacterium]MCP4469623.1 phage holin, lambda family [Gammaproteobacteria bacterium]